MNSLNPKIFIDGQSVPVSICESMCGSIATAYKFIDSFDSINVSFTYNEKCGVKYCCKIVAIKSNEKSRRQVEEAFQNKHYYYKSVEVCYHHVILEQNETKLVETNKFHEPVAKTYQTDEVSQKQQIGVIGNTNFIVIIQLVPE